ncbi:MAG: hypothetical protein JXB10_12760 [Pirellulales bacterium]|nr:hypothetical protein [Pirellulales bacterium]
MAFGRRLGIGLLLLPLVLGCASSPWTAKDQTPISSSPAKKPELSNTSENAPANQSNAPQTASGANSQAMQEVLAELQQMGGTDPQSQQKFLADLQQTDPALWPLLLQQSRAAAAYRKKCEEQTAAIKAGRSAPAPRYADAVAAPSFTSPEAASPPLSLLPPCPLASGVSPVTQTIFLNPQREEEPTNLSATKGPSKTPGQPASVYEKAPIQRTNFEKADPADSNQASPPEDRQISPSEQKWHRELNGAIQALESQIASDPKPNEDVALQARLRMLYALAGRRKEAVRPIPDVPLALQDFWSKELFGLTVFLEDGQTADASRRAAESKLHLSEALVRLGESAPLVVRNPAFCTAVQSYGCITPFKKYEFTPGQEVLLYAELENFTSQSTPKGFHTSLQSSYQILDVRGQRVTDHVFTTTEEYCQNYRRDFYIPYHLRMPSQMTPGRYTLQLTIEDLKSKKVGQATLEFTIKNPER